MNYKIQLNILMAEKHLLEMNFIEAMNWRREQICVLNSPDSITQTFDQVFFIDKLPCQG